ncbi:hypothetical protein LCGC14_2581840, partial [marine sediment metagenome]
CGYALFAGTRDRNVVDITPCKACEKAVRDKAYEEGLEAGRNEE